MKTALVATVQFHAWGHTYKIGQEVPIEHYMVWDQKEPGTLARRLTSGDVKYATLPDDAKGVEAPPADPKLTAAGVTFSDKDTAVKFAKDKFNLTLDARTSLETMVEKIREAADKEK